MKKTITIIAAMLIISLNTFSQAPNWAWATSQYGSNNDYGTYVATDAAGDVYEAGYFYSATLHCGSIMLANDSSGSSDMFIAKYNPSGTVIWAKSAGGTKNEVATSIAVDPSGYVYVTGYFQSDSITFGSVTLHNDTTNASDNIFLVKYDPNGNVIWAKSASGIGNYNFPYSVTTDASGKVYLAGEFDSPFIIFGPDTLENISIHWADVFLTKYDSSGNVIWVKNYGGSFSSSIGTAVNTDATGNVYLGGAFGCNTITIGTTTLSNGFNNGYYNIFLAKFDSAGNVLWAKSAGGPNGAGFINSASTDASGNTYVTGYFNSTDMTFGNDTITNNGTGNTFLAKYDSSGNVIWAKDAGGISDDEANSVAADNFGNVYIAGYFSSLFVIFGPDTLTNPDTLYRIFLAKYDTSGNVLWGKTSVGTSYDNASWVTTDNLGDVYLTGAFEGNAMNFGMITLLNLSPTTYDAFLAKIDVITGIEEYSQNNNGISVYPNPASSAITFKDLRFTIYDLRITDVLGNVVYSQPNINQQSTIINLSQLSKGVYFYQLSNSKETVRGKFVKE